MTIETYKFVCKCGEARIPSLVLMLKESTLMVPPGPPRGRSQKLRNDRAGLCVDDPDLFYAMCQNCLFTCNHRSPGRPKKYTDEERLWIRRNAPRIWRDNKLKELVQSYGSGGQWPTCIMCDNPATRTLYVGEFGKAPKANHAIRCRVLALKDEYWHSQFLPYCDFHEVMNIGQRKAHKQHLWQEHLNLTTWKASRTIEEIEASQ